MEPAGMGLLDTGVFIARESGRAMNTGLLPDQSVICPVTITELQAGVLIATDVDLRARRLATLESVADIEVLPIDRRGGCAMGASASASRRDRPTPRCQ